MSHAFQRTNYNCPGLDAPGSHEERRDASWERIPVPEEERNLIGSLARGTQELHLPVLDIDFPAQLIPSATEGHFHLYLDVPLPWANYEKLLRVLGEIGIIQPGYMDASIARKQTFVRPPEKPKPATPDASSSVGVLRP